MYYKLLQQNNCKPNGYLISVSADVLACLQLDAKRTVDQALIQKILLGVLFERNVNMFTPAK